MTVAEAPLSTEPANPALIRLASLLARPETEEGETTVWAHEVLPRGLSLRQLLAGAIRREWALQDARRRCDVRPRSAAVHRLRPGTTRAGLRERTLAYLRSGAVVELTAAASARGIDRVAAACGASLQGGLRVGAAGVVLVNAVIDGDPALLRIAGTEQLATHRMALARLGGNVKGVPRLLAAGSSATTAWTAETLLSGHRPGRLSRRLFADAVAFEGGLPRSAHDAAATARPDLHVLGEMFPRQAARLGQLADATDEHLQHVPSVTAHGDLWSGNLLVAGGRLGGVVDWDAYSDLAVPGVDLLHLFATDVALRRRLPRGSVMLAQPWVGDDFSAATRGYWDALGIRPTSALLASVGVAWWARQTAADVRRTPSLRENTSWVTANVDRVVSQYPLDRL